MYASLHWKFKTQNDFYNVSEKKKQAGMLKIKQTISQDTNYLLTG